MINDVQNKLFGLGLQLLSKRYGKAPKMEVKMPKYIRTKSGFIITFN